MDIPAIISVLNPYSVLKKLSLPLQKDSDNNLYTTLCPHCNKNTLQVGKKELFCPEAGCKFVSGSIVDYLSYYHGSYEQALEIIFEKFFDKLRDISVYDPEYAKSICNKQLKYNRDIFNYLLSLRTNLNNFNKFRASISYLRRYNINTNYVFNSIMFSTGEELNNLLDLITLPDNFEIENIEDEEEFIIKPYYANYYTIESLEFLRLSTQKTYTLKLYESKYSYLGLLQHSIDDKNFKVYGDANDVLSDISKSLEELKEIKTIHIKKNSGSNQLFRPSKLIYMYKPDADVSYLASIKSCCNQFYLSPHELFGYNRITIAWEEFLIEKFKQIVHAEKKITQEVIHFLESINITNYLHKKFTEFLKENGYASILSALDESSNINKITKFNSYDVLTTPYGYCAQKKGNASTIPFTNFIIDITSTIIFMNCDDIFYKGNLITHGQKYEITLSKSEIAQPAKIELAAQRAFKNCYSSGILPYNLPTITDNTLGKSLPQLIKTSANETQPVVGIDLIGWDLKSEKFITPLNEISVLTTERTIGKMHPYYDTFHNFSNKPFSGQDEFYCFDALNILSIVLAQLQRAYFGLSNHSIKVKSSANSKNLLKFIFRALGQISPIHINSNSRKNTSYEFKGLNNYPFYGMCENAEKLDAINLPGFILTSSGIPITDGYTKEQYYGITNFVSNILEEYIKYTLDTEGCSFEFEASPDKYYEDLNSIGKQIIQKLRPDVKFEDNKEVPLLKQRLYNIPAHKLGHYIKLDFDRQKAIITFSNHLAGMRSSILHELKEIDNTTKKEGCRYISCSIETINNIMQEVYNKKIELPLSNKSGKNNSEEIKEIAKDQTKTNMQ